MIDLFPELLVSLTVQTTLLLIVTQFLAKRESDVASEEDLFTVCHSVILVLCLCGCLLPHLRIIPQSVWPSHVLQVTAESVNRVAVLLMVIWGCGAVVLTLSTVLACLRASLLVQSSRALTSRETATVSFGNCGGVGADTPAVSVDRSSVLIKVNSLVLSPFCWQFHRPVIVLPETLLDFPPAELHAVIRHEMAHLKNRHPLRLFLQRIVEILFWFHPLVWKSSRRAAVVREMVSDQQAVTSREQAASLLRGLYRLVAVRSGATIDLPAGLAFASGGDSLSLRVSHLLRSVGERPDSGHSDRSDQLRLSRRRVRSVFRLFPAVIVAVALWLPVHPNATNRSHLSPWPLPSAIALTELGIAVRDYEVDAFRLQEERGARPEEQVW